jgi:hypothetical protein
VCVNSCYLLTARLSRGVTIKGKDIMVKGFVNVKGIIVKVIIIIL